MLVQIRPPGDSDRLDEKLALRWQCVHPNSIAWISPPLGPGSFDVVDTEARSDTIVFTGTPPNTNELRGS
jgi:hypothetical protein